MYKIKEEKAKEIKEKYKIQWVQKETEISQSYLSQLFNRKKECSSKLARIIANVLELEVDEIFDKVN